jgi:hypothetical protein
MVLSRRTSQESQHWKQPRCGFLCTAFGPAIAAWLGDPAVVEVVLNPDGQLWVDRLTTGLAETGHRLSHADGKRIIRLILHYVGVQQGQCRQPTRWLNCIQVSESESVTARQKSTTFRRQPAGDYAAIDT